MVNSPMQFQAWQMMSNPMMGGAMGVGNHMYMPQQVPGVNVFPNIAANQLMNNVPIVQQTNISTNLNSNNLAK